MLYRGFLENLCYCSHSNRFSIHKTFINFFWSCYSTSLNVENIVATPNQFFWLKNYTSYYYINSFSLLRIYFSLILSVSHIIQTQNTKQNPILKIKLNQNKQIWREKKKKFIWTRFSHNPNTKQNPILKIKLNQNKQIWREKKNWSNPVSHIIQTQNKIQFLK